MQPIDFNKLKHIHGCQFMLEYGMKRPILHNYILYIVTSIDVLNRKICIRHSLTQVIAIHAYKRIRISAYAYLRSLIVYSVLALLSNIWKANAYFPWHRKQPLFVQNKLITERHEYMMKCGLNGFCSLYISYVFSKSYFVMFSNQSSNLLFILF